MAKDPAGRPTSAAEFARTLQSIEVEQRYDLTPLEVTQDHSSFGADQPIDADAGSTRIKGPSVIDSQSRFSVTGIDAMRGPTPRRAADPIISAPFAVPTPPPKIPRTARAGGGLGPGNRRPASASYRNQPGVVQPAAPQRRQLRPTSDRLAHVGRDLIAAAAAGVGAIVVAVALLLILSGSSAVTAPADVQWGPDGSQAKVVWSRAGGGAGDSYLVTYQGQTIAKYPASSTCHAIDSGIVCLVPSEGAEPEPVTVFRISGGKLHRVRLLSGRADLGLGTPSTPHSARFAR